MVALALEEVYDSVGEGQVSISDGKCHSNIFFLQVKKTCSDNAIGMTVNRI